MSVTEFDELDPTSLHLVGAGANGFPVLLAKAAEILEDTVDDEAGLVKECGTVDCDVCAEALEKKKLKAKTRNALPDSDFALPGRRYPIHDASHARNALARVSQHGTPEEKSKVRAAVHRRYPDMGADNDSDDAEKALASQAATQRRKAIPSPSSLEGQTHEMAREDALNTDVLRDDNGEQNAARYNQPRPRQNSGYGDTAPSKVVPRAEAQSQTAGAQVTRKADPDDGDGSGDSAPDGDDDADDAKEEAGSQTRAESRKADAGSEPGSPAWERKDAETIAAAIGLLRQVESRERAEVGATTKSAIEVLEGLLGSDVNNDTSAQKGLEDMTQDELIKLLDERDARAEAKKALKKERKAREAEEAAKAAGDSGDAAKSATESEAPAAEPSMMDMLKSLSDRVDAIAAQPAGRNVTLSGAGMAAGAAALAVERGQSVGPDDRSGDPFAIFKERVEKATSPGQRKAAETDLMKARMIMAEQNRRNPRQGEGVPLLAPNPTTGDTAPFSL